MGKFQELTIIVHSVNEVNLKITFFLNIRFLMRVSPLFMYLQLSPKSSLDEHFLLTK